MLKQLYVVFANAFNGDGGYENIVQIYSQIATTVIICTVLIIIGSIIIINQIKTRKLLKKLMEEKEDKPE